MIIVCSLSLNLNKNKSSSSSETSQVIKFEDSCLQKCNKLAMGQQNPCKFKKCKIANLDKLNKNPNVGLENDISCIQTVKKQNLSKLSTSNKIKEKCPYYIKSKGNDKWTRNPDIPFSS